MARPTTFVNVSDLLGPEWRFLEPETNDPRLRFDFVRGLPANAMERAVRRPNLARWRAALEAARAARAEGSVLVSHLPRMSAAANLARRAFAPRARHLAFSFNFTDPPVGRAVGYYRRALGSVDRFVVYSRYEKGFYADLLGLQEDRIDFLPWAMETPVYDEAASRPVEGDYLCAVGGEARDYAMLFEAMRALPDLPMVVIARPYSVAGLTAPANVTVMTNVPPPITWRIARDALAMAIPLRSSETACGHVTIVGAQRLGLPLAVTR
ncbi:MAG: hypothetical protein AAGF90_09435, partial [Pseudomonadota bacterium]